MEGATLVSPEDHHFYSCSREEVEEKMETQDWSDRYDRYMESCFLAMEKASSEGYETLTEKERIVLHMHLLDAEVSNGGFNQYFSNYSGDYALDTVESLRLIGAIKTLALLIQALDVFGPNPPSNERMARCEQIDALPETSLAKWRELDQEFFAFNEDLINLALNYVEGPPAP